MRQHGDELVLATIRFAKLLLAGAKRFLCLCSLDEVGRHRRIDFSLFGDIPRHGELRETTTGGRQRHGVATPDRSRYPAS